MTDEQRQYKYVKCIKQPMYVDTDEPVLHITIGKVYKVRSPLGEDFTNDGAHWFIDRDNGMMCCIRQWNNTDDWFNAYFICVEDPNAYLDDWDRAMGIL